MVLGVEASRALGSSTRLTEDERCLHSQLDGAAVAP